MGTLLLATDGSMDAKGAAKHAIDLAKEDESTLHVLCVVDRRRFNQPAFSSGELATIYAEDTAELCVTGVEALAADCDIHIVVETREGKPLEVILEYADEIDADVIVLGDHGDHTAHFSRVRRRVIESADCEVVVVSANIKTPA